nr:ABC transporter substrate-binding protein [Conservatibacter flavescens]
MACGATEVLAAPRVPDELTQNGLIYCTHASGFSFNPQTADAGTSMNVVTEQIYNKLFEIKNHTSEVTPVLAQSYHVSLDGKVITINLRRGVKFHYTEWFTPTRDFNAEDVVFSLNRVLGHNEDLPTLDNARAFDSPQYTIFNNLVKKARFPYFESINLKSKIESVRAVGPYQVEIRLFSPDASILSHLASQYAIIFSREYALQLNADNNLAQLDLLPVGTGPYQLKNYMRNQVVRLVRNENYWRKKPQIENIVIDVSTSRIGRLAKFFNGECQIVAFPEVSQLGLFKEDNSRFLVQSTEGMNLSFLAFNFQKEAMNDILLRRAIAKSIDRHRIVRHIYYDTATVAEGIIPQISWAVNNKTQRFDYDYDPQWAKTVLSDRQLDLTMWVVNEEQVYNPAPIKMAELIRMDLAKVGVNVKVKNVSRNYLMQQLQAKTEDYDLILTGWLAGTFDPDTFLRPILSCGTQNEVTNLSNWCYRPFDDMIDRALRHRGTLTRNLDYNIAQQTIFEQVPIVPIANVKRVLIADSRVKGLNMSAFGSIRFETLSLTKQGGKP